MAFTRNTIASSTADKFILRLPDGMREVITQTAHADHRSMNSEIIMRLERSFELDSPGQDVLPPPFDDADLNRSEHQLLRTFRQLSRRHQSALIDLLGQETRTVAAPAPEVIGDALHR